MLTSLPKSTTHFVKKPKDDVQKSKPMSAGLESPAKGSTKPKAIEKPVKEVEATQARVGVPAGLSNYRRACFANASLQCLFGVPELTARYQPFASGALTEPKSKLASFPDMDRQGKSTRGIDKQREAVRAIFEQQKDQM